MASIWVTDEDGSYDLFDRTQDGFYFFAARNITNSPDSDESEPALSPDGKRVAFVSNRSGNDEIYVGSSGNVVSAAPLASDPAADGHPSWSPDGQKVAFHSNRNNGFEIYVVDRKGTGLQRLTDSAGDNQNPEWSPDGTTIVFDSDRDGNLELYAVKVDDPQEEQRITSTTSNESQPDWSGDGERIAYISDQDGQTEIYRMRADGTERIRLTTSDVFKASPMYILSISRNVIYFSADEGRFERPDAPLTAVDWGLYRMLDDGSELKLIVGGIGTNERWATTAAELITQRTDKPY